MSEEMQGASKVPVGDDGEGSSSSLMPPSPKSQRNDAETTYPFYLVGLGASAGGLEALELFFANVPEQSGLAYVVVQHLSPDFKSLMDELLRRRTRLSIYRVEDGMEIVPDSIYLIPPKKEMVVKDRRLWLSEQERDNKTLPLPIDTFFHSLARDAGKKAIGVILSGTGSDGSRGVRHVNSAGGLVLAHSPESAKFDGMPRAAIDTGLVDYILPPDQMPDVMVRYANRSDDMEIDHFIANQPISQSDLETAFDLLRHSFGIDFSLYKGGTVARRIERRIEISCQSNLTSYVQLLKSDPGELNQLYFDFLIGVTKFFRDPEAFEYLEREVIPTLIERLEPEEELRVWVAGCATGEEAYSIAILLHEAMAARGRALMYKIFATDVHPESLEIASAGLYEATALSGISPDRLARFFKSRGKSYQISLDVRSRIVFSRHNITQDAPFTRLDLISCRNLLIYLQLPAQRKALSLFHFGLKVGGILTLGPSETTGDLGDELEVVEPHWKIYRKRRAIRLRTEFATATPATDPMGWSNISRMSRAGDRSFPLMGIYDSLLDTFIPPSILVNERREVVHCFGGGGKILAKHDGRFSSDLLDMVEERLRVPLAAALHRVSKSGETVAYGEIPITIGGESKLIDLSVRQIIDERSRMAYRLISVSESKRAPMAAVPSAVPVTLDMESVSTLRLREVEVELQYTKENLQAAIEELETSNEELQATNEELIASNEELQSTNEELHSVNEELYTVNSEHQKKIEELTELTHDLDNLFVSCDIGIIFLDSDRRIRKFTPRIADQFPLIPQDAGRRIDGFAHTLVDAPIIDIIKDVIGNGKLYDSEVRDFRGRWHLLRVLPYFFNKEIDGAILSLVDISRLKEAEAISKQMAEIERINLNASFLARQEAEQARDALRRRDRFLAMLSHELRNPLNAITLASNLLDRNDIDPAALAEARLTAQRQAKHLGCLLDDLLDVSRLDNDKLALRPEPIDLRNVVREVFGVVGPTATDKKIELRSQFESAPDCCWVIGDPSRLQQIVVNLVHNAIKYTYTGGSVVVRLTHLGEEVGVHVTDTGRGISPEVIDRVFDLFFQHEEPSQSSSMGIGLALVKRLVELHRGRVTARSEGLGRGSEFTATFPRHVVNLLPPETQNQPKAKVRGKGKSIVVVEDNADSRQMMRILLELEGYEVASASDGEQGLELIKRIRPHLALVDIGLPKLDGCELARQIRSDADYQDTVLVAVTGYGQAADREQVAEAGFDDCLIKPVRPAELTTFVARRIQ